MSVVADRLREAREAKGLSQERLAADVGVSWSTINRYERGVTTPTLGRLQVLADALEVPLSSLVQAVKA